MRCQVTGCDIAATKTGLCNKHYLRKRRHGDPLFGGRERIIHDRLGQMHRPEYKAWDAMVRRCHSEKDGDYPSYGGRGIAVCDRWRGSFSAFLEDMGFRPSTSHSLDRRDNDGPYSPANCRWATKSEQANNRRNTRSVRLDGMEWAVGELVKKTGVPRNTLYMRIFRYGWSVEKAIGRSPC